MTTNNIPKIIIPSIQSLERVRNLKRNGMSEQELYEFAYDLEKGLYKEKEFRDCNIPTLEERVANWLEMFRRLKVD